MKRLNFNIKDRKLLTLGLCLVLVCVFTLTVAYSALNAVLTINGNARVSAADWDIYLNNPRVTSGSATTNVPVIKTSSTLEFETTLNMPGDFYEFTVDVVNAGDIDAMIENVIKTPELTTEQAKFLKYEVSYQNGESITTKQLLAKDTTMPIKVRVEYRKDLSNTDLPTSQVVLDLALTLEYVQSDGTGSSVTGNGFVQPVADGSLDSIGTIVTIGDQQFYTIGTENNNVKLLTKYNLFVGRAYNTSVWEYEDYNEDEITGMQDERMTGVGPTISHGITVFANMYQQGTNLSDYNGSVLEMYTNNYKNLLESNYGITLVEARGITYQELTSDEFGCEKSTNSCSKSSHPWIYSTSYWTGSAEDEENVWRVDSGGGFYAQQANAANLWGVRPVIVISKDYFN